MSSPADCPRCGFAAIVTPACPRCGVILAKVRTARVRPAAPAAPGASSWWLLAVVVVGTGAVVGLRMGRRNNPPNVTLQAVTPVSRPISRPAPRPLPSARALPPPAGAVAPADVAAYLALVSRVNARGTISDDDVQVAASLRARYPTEPEMSHLLIETLLFAADRQKREGHAAQAIASLRQAISVAPTDARAHIVLINLLTEAGDWPAVEAAAQETVAVLSKLADAWYALGHAQFRQDRAREAVQALTTCLEIAEHAEARALLNRIQKNLADEHGMTDQHISHFHVRYDGDSHDDVGREILAALERHYSTLVNALDYEPHNTVPVILFSRDRYFQASGAPAWSGGVYDNLDGRIRIPIGGVARGLSPEVDNTLMHELTHAFINEKAGGHAPREIHEGLAQYMAGDRIADELRREELALLARGRIGGVQGFYFEALSFMEYLIAQRGLGGVNDMLHALADSADIDNAFRQTYGQDYAGTQRAWHDRLAQEYGGN